jgi:hypothetical protein
MGTFVFKWEHDASEVYVTGTFDDWTKSEKLIQTGNVFEKNVTLPSAAEKIYYKVRKDKLSATIAQKGRNFCSKHLDVLSSAAKWIGRVSKYIPAGVRPSGMRQNFIWRQDAGPLASYLHLTYDAVWPASPCFCFGR